MKKVTEMDGEGKWYWLVGHKPSRKEMAEYTRLAAIMDSQSGKKCGGVCRPVTKGG